MKPAGAPAISFFGLISPSGAGGGGGGGAGGGRADVFAAASVSRSAESSAPVSVFVTRRVSFGTSAVGFLGGFVITSPFDFLFESVSFFFESISFLICS